MRLAIFYFIVLSINFWLHVWNLLLLKYREILIEFKYIVNIYVIGCTCYKTVINICFNLSLINYLNLNLSVILIDIYVYKIYLMIWIFTLICALQLTLLKIFGSYWAKGKLAYIILFGNGLYQAIRNNIGEKRNWTHFSFFIKRQLS